MKWGWVLVPLALVLVGHCASPARGAPVSLCGPWEVVEAELERVGGEVPVAAWIERDGGVMRLYANAEADTWTLVLERAGLTCTLRDGTGVAVLGVRNGD